MLESLTIEDVGYECLALKLWNEGEES